MAGGHVGGKNRFAQRHNVVVKIQVANIVVLRRHNKTVGIKRQRLDRPNIDGRITHSWKATLVKIGHVAGTRDRIRITHVDRWTAR